MDKETFINTVADINKQISALKDQVRELESKRRGITYEYAVANREFENGEKVTVVSGLGNEKTEHGIIRCIGSVEDWGAIKYRIAALKKDGTAHATKKVRQPYGSKVVKYRPDTTTTN